MPAVAAPLQRPPTRRPVPVAADTRRLRQGPGRTPAVRTPAAVCGRSRGRLQRPGPQPTRQPLRGHHPAVRTASPGGRSSASIPDTLAVSAGGGRCPLPHPAGGPGWSATGGCAVPVLLRTAAVSAVRLGMPPGAARTAAVHRGHGRGVRFCGHLLGSAPGPRRRRTATVRTIRRWTRLVDTGRRLALPTPATAAVAPAAATKV
jgi:hypothetical protein